MPEAMNIVIQIITLGNKSITRLLTTAEQIDQIKKYATAILFLNLFYLSLILPNKS